MPIFRLVRLQTRGSPRLLRPPARPSSRHAAARVPAHPMAGLVTGSRFPTCEQRACGDPMNAISEDLVWLSETAYRAGPWIDFDPQAFDPWRIMAVDRKRTRLNSSH